MLFCLRCGNKEDEHAAKDELWRVRRYSMETMLRSPVKCTTGGTNYIPSPESHAGKRLSLAQRIRYLPPPSPLESCPTNTNTLVNVGEMTIVDSQQAAINISCKSHGSQLDTTTMTAIEVGNDGYPVYQPDDASSTRLKLRFRSESDLTEFMIRYQELQQVVKSQALLRVTTTASSRLSSSSRRRDSGTAHANRRSS